MLYAIIVLVVLVVLVISAYNSIIVLKNRAKNQFAQVDVVLKTRADLIPNLVESIRGATDHEEGTLTAVISARNSYLTAKTPEDKIESQKGLEGALSKIFALAESYPDLKANQNFLALNKTLEETEEKIRFARQFYNDAVMKYNIKIQTVPTNIIAGLFKFSEMKLFEASVEDKEVPKVDFKV